MSLRSVIQKNMTGEKDKSTFWELFTSWMALCYWAAVVARNSRYDKRSMAAEKLPVPVISIGNLTLGGTGKTPVVMEVASKLRDRGLKVAILARGYGRKGREKVLCVSSGQGPMVNAEQAGDEPYLMAKRLHGVGVWVGKNRLKVANVALSLEGPDVFVLDDGFQHRAVFRDLDIVVARVPVLWGKEKVIPRGPMREPVSSLKRAHVLVLNGEASPTERLFERCFFPNLVFLRGRLRPTLLRRVINDEPVSLDEIRGCKIGAFCGIGDPHSFVETLKDLGLEIRRFLPFVDHHWYTPKDLVLIREATRGLDFVVTTEKDACKLRGKKLDLKAVMALEVKMELFPGRLMERLLDECCPQRVGHCLGGEVGYTDREA